MPSLTALPACARLAYMPVMQNMLRQSLLRLLLSETYMLRDSLRPQNSVSSSLMLRSWDGVWEPKFRGGVSSSRLWVVCQGIGIVVAGPKAELQLPTDAG